MPAYMIAEAPAAADVWSRRTVRGAITGGVRPAAGPAPRCEYCGGRLGSRPVWRDGRAYCDAYCAVAVPGLYLG